MINNTVDILLILIVIYNILRGWQSGLIFGLLDLVIWIGSLLAAFRFYNQVAPWLSPLVALSESLTRPLAFVLIAIVIGILLNLLSRFLTQLLSARIHTHYFNRVFGLLTGLIGGFIVISIFSSLMMALPLPHHVSRATRESGLVNHFATLSQQLESELRPIFGDAISQTLNWRTIHPESDEMVQLSYTVTDALPAPELEVEMLQLINLERAKVGLSAIQMDSELTAVARQHSSDMFRRGYFAHNTPEGLTPFDRIQAGGISYRIAGENLAHAPTLLIAHNGLMNSPGHRENLLRSEFGRVGIGILDGGSRGLMVTQNFRD